MQNLKPGHLFSVTCWPINAINLAFIFSPVEAMKQRDEALKGVNILENKISELSEKISRYDKEMEGKDSEKERLEADIARFTAHLKENEEILKGKEKEVKEVEDRLDTIQLDKENNLAERKMLESEKESQNQDDR